MRKVAKSGWPVFGHRQVNSGHSKRISYSRPERGLAKVSSDLAGRVGMGRRVSPRAARGVNRPALALIAALAAASVGPARGARPSPRSPWRLSLFRRRPPPEPAAPPAPPPEPPGVAEARNRETDRMLAYHERTKHSYATVYGGGWSLDWDNQPNPFRR